MYTAETALDALKKFDISETDIDAWAQALHLEIPVDAYGRKQYSPHHVNLFKNVRKHLALGRTMDEIRKIVALPTLENSQPKSPGLSSHTTKSAYASVPRQPLTRENHSSGANQVVALVQKLTSEKDQLYKKLLETEKLNSHLYSANTLYHRKVKDLTGNMSQLRDQIKENENFKLLDDKARLHKQLLEVEKLNQSKDEQLQYKSDEVQMLQGTIRHLEQKIEDLHAGVSPDKFCGDWMESGHLLEVVYDNFGINIETERSRLFRIAEAPARLYGNTAMMTTTYQYESNSLWQRSETLTVVYSDDATLEGELLAEYVLDSVPVAKAIYRVTCRRTTS